MASVTQCLRTPMLRRPLLLRPAVRWQSSSPDFEHIETELKSRKIPVIFDDLSPQSSFRLSITLADFLPDANAPALLPPTTDAPLLPIPHHLVHFEPTKPSSVMLPDGTNPDQSPGEPFVRRMWAGGRVRYNQSNPFALDSSRGVCAEFIRSVTPKGDPGSGNEKIFVGIERRQAKASDSEIAQIPSALNDPQARQDLDHRVRQRLWRDDENDFGPCSVLETRNIVFLRSRTAEQAAADNAKARQKQLTPSHTPTWSHTVLPDAKLLFRFSALTFNAHAIHLDPVYSQQIEGHRERLFHGPLTYVFMLTLLQQQLRKQGNAVVKQVDYRNLAPLYCGEPVTFCGAQSAEHKWEVWAQMPDGGLAVKGSVGTEEGTIDRANLGI